MPGLNFQTSTIINSNFDPDSKAVLFESIKGDEDKDNELFIKRDFHFFKDNEKGRVCSIRKRAGYEAAMCKAEIDFSGMFSGKFPESGELYCRLNVYVTVEGAEPYIFSNPSSVQKGMPLWVEFTVKEDQSPTSVAEEVAKSIKKNSLFLIDKDIVNVTVDGSKLTLEGANEFLRFKSITVTTFDSFDEYSVVLDEMGTDGGNISLKERGYNSFGTYSEIIKDLRLPTMANTQWSHLRKVETPIVGAIYNQYLIEYVAPSVNDGVIAVGHRPHSHTIHSFWVKNDTELLAAWESALKDVGEIEGICCDGHYEPQTMKVNVEVPVQVVEELDD